MHDGSQCSFRTKTSDILNVLMSTKITKHVFACFMLAISQVYKWILQTYTTVQLLVVILKRLNV